MIFVLSARDLIVTPILKELRVHYLRQKRNQLSDDINKEKFHISKAISYNTDEKSSVLFNPYM